MQGELLSRLCAADGQVDVGVLTDGLGSEGDGTVLDSFRAALNGAGDVAREEAARAFRDTLPRL